MMNVQLHTSNPTHFPMAGLPYDLGGSSEEVVLKHLKTEAEIASILHLREEIDLSVHAAAGRQQFAELEKKETSWALSAAST